mgnify:FL=1
MWLKELDELQEHYKLWDKETKPNEDDNISLKKKIKVKRKKKKKIKSV